MPFTFGGRTAHWMDLYTGFGLAISVPGFAITIMAWRLGTASASEKYARNGPRLALPQREFLSWMAPRDRGVVLAGVRRFSWLGSAETQ